MTGVFYVGHISQSISLSKFKGPKLADLSTVFYFDKTTYPLVNGDKLAQL